MLKPSLVIVLNNISSIWILDDTLKDNMTLRVVLDSAWILGFCVEWMGRVGPSALDIISAYPYLLATLLPLRRNVDMLFAFFFRINSVVEFDCFYFYHVC